MIPWPLFFAAPLPISPIKTHAFWQPSATDKLPDWTFQVTFFSVNYLVKFRHFRAWFDSGRIRVSFDETDLTAGKLP